MVPPCQRSHPELLASASVGGAPEATRCSHLPRGGAVCGAATNESRLKPVLLRGQPYQLPRAGPGLLRQHGSLPRKRRRRRTAGGGAAGAVWLRRRLGALRPKPSAPRSPPPGAGNPGWEGRRPLPEPCRSLIGTVIPLRPKGTTLPPGLQKP